MSYLYLFLFQNELYLLSDSRKLVDKPEQKSRKRKKDKKVKDAKDTNFKVIIYTESFLIYQYQSPDLVVFF